MLAAIDEFALLSWPTWAIIGAGCCTALLAVMFSRLVQVRRRGDPPVPVAERPKHKPVERQPNRHDPFDYGSITDKRRAPRRNGSAIAILITDADAIREPTRGHVLDRSMGGLRLVSQNEVAAGTVICLKPVKGPPATPWVQVEVRSCKKDEAGYEICCQFLRTPPWAVLLLFG
jgi:hypothetical protein